MTLRKLAQDPRVARAFSEDAGFGQRRYWVELADGYETDAGGTSLAEDSIEELWESLRELVRPVRAARRNPIEGDITTNTFHTRGARGTARFERNHARKRPDWYVYLGRRTKPLLLDVSQYGAELNSFGDEWLGHVRLGSRRAEGNPELTCDLPPGALYGVPVTLAELDSTVRGYGVALGIYALVARALPPRTALLADGCIDNGSTSDQAERVWLSLERDGQVGVRGYHGTAYARRNPKKRGAAPPTVQQVAQAVAQLERAVDEPERLTPAVLRVLRAAGWREGDPVHDPRVDWDNRHFDAQVVVSDLSGPGFDLAGEMWR